MDAVVLNSQGVSASYRDGEVGKFLDLFGAIQGLKFEANGDVEKGCQAIFDVVIGTGKGVGKEKCIRLPLSVDYAERTRGQIQSLQENPNFFKTFERMRSMMMDTSGRFLFKSESEMRGLWGDFATELNRHMVIQKLDTNAMR